MLILCSSPDKCCDNLRFSLIRNAHIGNRFFSLVKPLCRRISGLSHQRFCLDHLYSPAFTNLLVCIRLRTRVVPLTVYSPTFFVYPDDVYPRTTLARVYGKEPDSQDLSPCCSVFRSRFLRQVTVIRLSYISQHRNSIHRNMSYFLWCWLPWPEMLPGINVICR